MTKFGKIFCNLVANFKGVQLQGCSCLRCTNNVNRAIPRWCTCLKCTNKANRAISRGCTCLKCTNKANRAISRGCTCLKCTNKANSANYRRVWHPCHTHAPIKLSSHRTLRSLSICGHLCTSVGGSSPPKASVNSVISVGEPYAAKPSVCICKICGRLFSARSFCVFRGFRGRTLRSLT